MIHSISFVILNVWIPDFFEFPVKFKRYDRYKYVLTYKGVTFNYYLESQTLLIRTNTHKILKKGFVTLNDLEPYTNRLMTIVKEVVGNKKYLLQLSRVDYYVDLSIDLECEEQKNILELLYKHLHSYRHMKMSDKSNINNSFYLKTKRGTYNLNCYYKFAQSGILDYRNTFRIELQIKKNKFKREFKKYGITRELVNYWSKDGMQMYYFDFLQDFFYSGDYYRIDIAIEKIENSLYTKSMQKKLILFIKRVNEIGMTETKKFYSYSTFKNYIKKLGEIGLNPVTLRLDGNFLSMENLLSRAKRVAEKIYFRKED